MKIKELRCRYHERIFSDIVRITRKENRDAPNFADNCSTLSTRIAKAIIENVGLTPGTGSVPSQTAGKRFGDITRDFLNQAFDLLHHIRPGKWLFSANQGQIGIASFDQYEHLQKLDELFQEHKELKTALGHDYLVIPDIVIGRYPIDDIELNLNGNIVSNDEMARLTTLRKNNYINPKPILHASISCKWTIRSDRSQNTRTEALNLIRNRKGKTPHIVAVTAEPLPNRLNSLAMGTGDIDCVYHFALYEMLEAIQSLEDDNQKEMIDCLVNGKRLRDISDLPFDLMS